jgi:hypothetical protein
MWESFVERLKGWRTVAINAFLAIAALIAEILAALAGFDWSTIVSPMWLPWVLIGVTVLNIVLRWLTTTPVGVAKEPEA